MNKKTVCSILALVIVCASIVAFMPKVQASSWEAALGRPIDDGTAFWINTLLIAPDSGTHYSKINETISDGDGTFVHGIADAIVREDRYWFGLNQTIPSNATNVNVQIFAVCRSMSPTYKAHFRIAVGLLGMDYEYSSAFSPSTSYTTYNYNTTIYGSGVNYGIEISAGYDERRDLYYWGRCTQMYVIVTYYVP